jgi:hypothetical protein
MLLLQGTLFTSPMAAVAESGDTRCVVLEIYVREQEPASEDAVARIAALSKTRPGLVVATRDISREHNLERFERVAKYYGVSDSSTPLVYACNRVISGYRDEGAFDRQLREILQIEVFMRHGCPRCARARNFLDHFSNRYRGLTVTYRDIVYDSQARADMNRLVARHRTSAASVPVFHLCDRLIIGYSNASSTQSRLETTLRRWTKVCAAKTDQTSAHDSTPIVFRTPLHAVIRKASLWWPIGAVTMLEASSGTGHSDLVDDMDLDDEFTLPLPDDTSKADLDEGPPAMDDSSNDTLEAVDVNQAVKLPLFGELSARRVGLPALTIAVGLVDGFNPCAMWVLLFLLSLLVNLKDRRRILVIAGTFILVSGLAYFAFMAAWLNVFIFVGYLRPIQIALGVIAIAIGSVHIKDFFAFHRGFSLSIPEAAKPGIYARTRRIITAENIAGALAGATILAVMVNVVELLCTAGLPALYTEILTMHELPMWQNYAYLALYNICYMLDDTLMVAVVVVSLSKRKLQEEQGRWLKLVSGAVIAVLGAIMIVNPELLV